VLEKGTKKIKLSRDPFNESLNFLINLREDERIQNQASNKQYLIINKDFR
jgi:hypothetical protein